MFLKEFTYTIDIIKKLISLIKLSKLESQNWYIIVLIKKVIINIYNK